MDLSTTYLGLPLPHPLMPGASPLVGDLDLVRRLMAGAHAVQMVSALLDAKPEDLRGVRQDMAEWLERREYNSLDQVRGSMSLNRCPDPMAYERANYMEILQSWRR